MKQLWIILAPRSLEGYYPQGRFLGIFLLIVQFNPTLLCRAIPGNNNFHQIHELISPTAKYMDAIIIVSKVAFGDLKKDHNTRHRTLTFNDRTEHVLSNECESMQARLSEVDSFGETNLGIHQFDEKQLNKYKNHEI